MKQHVHHHQQQQQQLHAHDLQPSHAQPCLGRGCPQDSSHRSHSLPIPNARSPAQVGSLLHIPSPPSVT